MRNLGPRPLGSTWPGCCLPLSRLKVGTGSVGIWVAACWQVPRARASLQARVWTFPLLSPALHGHSACLCLCPWVPICDHVMSAWIHIPFRVLARV